MEKTNLLETCFTRNESFISRKVIDEFILVPIRKRTEDINSLYALNDVAAYIWDLIDGKRCAKDIQKEIVEEFAVSPEEAEIDLEEFLEQLKQIEAVRVI
ncbi:MAG: PqqD family protein [Deltaproteobacteria bacterium]|nr:PqqD family protein [Deltaproteobacteria bacterium]MBW1812835.1 PqqD family protein [Deltaproteobacteria bacterium]MBW1848238.1 PqqD family protein [Deltaproteobacteria bacterium]MBW2364066.1 PqqD family protein [Deltaproteobacteria bacterium]